MAWRIKQEKILLVLAIKEQEDGCLAKEVLQEQVRMERPGLGQEVMDICREIGLPDATKEEIVIQKEDVKEAILMNHLKYLKVEMKGKKLENMVKTDMRRRREYTKYSVEECRMAFRLETFQFDCRANMPTRYGRDLRCRACSPQKQRENMEQRENTEQRDKEENIEDQEHLESCPGYSELWEGLGPYSPRARLQYFMRVKLKRLKQRQNKHTAENEN